MSAQPEKLGTSSFVLGGLSFIPAIGIFFGIAAIIVGLTSNKEGGRKLAAIGACGIGFSVILYSALFYFGFVQRGGIYDDLRTKLAQSSITSLVPAIEFYKLQHGQYPDSLDTLRKSLPQDAMVFTDDPTDTRFGSQPHNFYYQLIDQQHYYLLSLGPDGKPFTSDDILPTVDSVPGSHIGLVIKRN